jgi:hypothetical protein
MVTDKIIDIHVLFERKTSMTAENLPENFFSPTLWGDFCTPQASSSFAASTKAVYAAPAETTYED